MKCLIYVKHLNVDAVGCVALQLQGPWFDPELGLLPVWGFLCTHGFPPCAQDSFHLPKPCL